MANDFDLQLKWLNGSQIEVQATDATSISGDEKVLIIQDGVAKEVTTQDVADLGGGGNTYWTKTGNDIQNNNSGNVQIGMDVNANMLYDVGNNAFTFRNATFKVGSDVLPYISISASGIQNLYLPSATQYTVVSENYPDGIFNIYDAGAGLLNFFLGDWNGNANSTYIQGDDGSKIIQINAINGIKFSVIPEYADNAAAITGGLTAGFVYRTGDVLKIVH